MMEITQMTESHVTGIAALEKHCFSDPWSENSIRGEVCNSLALWLVAVDGDKIAGYVGSQTVMGEADMMNIAVAPEYRRKGIARALVERLVAQLKAQGCYQITLEVRASNAAAITLYQQLGFSQVGCRPRYYRNPKEDALILRKEWDL